MNLYDVVIYAENYSMLHRKDSMEKCLAGCRRRVREKSDMQILPRAWDKAITAAITACYPEEGRRSIRMGAWE